MRGRKVRDQEHLKNKIVQVARALVEEKGLAALNVREIAGRAGCAVGMVYKALGGIDDIVIHINARTLDELHAALKEVAAENKNASLEQVLSAIANAYIDYHRSNPHFWHAFFEYHYAEGYEVPAFFDEKIESIFAIIESALEPALGGNRERAFTLARVLWAGVHGVCTLTLRGSLSRVKIESGQELVEELVSGIALRARENSGTGQEFL